MKQSAKAPASFASVAAAASVGARPRSRKLSQRCATVSVSVCEVNFRPSAVSASRNSRKFSMIPLCTTATRRA
jgi:hypothetical protein